MGSTMMESFNGRFQVENVYLFHEATNTWDLGRRIAR